MFSSRLDAAAEAVLGRPKRVEVEGAILLRCGRRVLVAAADPCVNAGDAVRPFV